MVTIAHNYKNDMNNKKMVMWVKKAAELQLLSCIIHKKEKL